MQARDPAPTRDGAAANAWQVRGGSISLQRTVLMGILNVTPDSFSDGGEFVDVEKAVDRALAMEADGAEIIDIGGESTRPGSESVSEGEELARVVPVVARFAGLTKAWISVDTTKAVVAREALAAGAHIVNDISALRGDPAMPDVVASYQAGLVLMHMLGTPRTMQINPAYEDPVGEVRVFLEERRRFGEEHGISASALVADPGIGFGKRVEDNLALLRAGREAIPEGMPLLLGFSKKSFIARVLGEEQLARRTWPSIGLSAYAVLRGAAVVRAHDVKACHEAVRMAEAILRVRPC